MAQRTQILYVDDIDGSEAEGTVRFGLDGTEYEIDLNKKHSAQFTKAIRPYIDAARKVSRHPGGRPEVRVRPGITSPTSGRGHGVRA